MILFIKHIAIEGPATLGTDLSELGFDIKVCELHQGEALPDDLSGIDAVVSLGGPMNVYEEQKHPFLCEDDVFLKKVLAQEVPFLGLCLGSQLLAKASGGAVIRSPQEEIGWFDVELNDKGLSDPLFHGLPQTMEVYQWHGDMCVPPESAVLLASSERCPVQAFRVGKNAYGLQFHAEVAGEDIEQWALDYTPEKKEMREAMLARYVEVGGVFRAYGRILCQNFARLIRLR